MSSAPFCGLTIKDSGNGSYATEAVCAEVLTNVVGCLASHVYPAGVELFRQDVRDRLLAGKTTPGTVALEDCRTGRRDSNDKFQSAVAS